MKLDGHTKGVYSCDWSALHRCIISGGADKSVCLFNPFSGKKQATLEGHRAGVCDVMMNDKDHQIISVGMVSPEPHSQCLLSQDMICNWPVLAVEPTCTCNCRTR